MMHSGSKASRRKWKKKCVIQFATLFVRYTQENTQVKGNVI